MSLDWNISKTCSTFAIFYSIFQHLVWYENLFFLLASNTSSILMDPKLISPNQTSLLRSDLKYPPAYFDIYSRDIWNILHSKQSSWVASIISQQAPLRSIFNSVNINISAQLLKPDPWDSFLIPFSPLPPTPTQPNLSFNLVNSTIKVCVKPSHTSSPTLLLLQSQLLSSLTGTLTIASSRISLCFFLIHLPHKSWGAFLKI